MKGEIDILNNSEPGFFPLLNRLLYILPTDSIEFLHS
jgi:hypothetical protein